MVAGAVVVDTLYQYVLIVFRFPQLFPQEWHPGGLTQPTTVLF
jgi:hypothetical protein